MTTNRYAKFAAVYDELMEDVPYNRYVELIELAASGIAGKKILDVGCGTGLLTAKLAKAGGEVTAIDISPAMLEVAKNRAESFGLSIEFFEQPMQQLEVSEQYDIAVISIDSLNYVLEEAEVKETFFRIYQALKPGGVLLFDVHSTFKTDLIFMESPFVLNEDRIAYIWETEEGDMPNSVYSELSFFVKLEDGRYERFNEVHMQRTLPIYTYVEMLEENGFTIERIFADWEDEAPDDESERIFYQVRK